MVNSRHAWTSAREVVTDTFNKQLGEPHRCLFLDQTVLGCASLRYLSTFYARFAHHVFPITSHLPPFVGNKPDTTHGSWAEGLLHQSLETCPRNPAIGTWQILQGAIMCFPLPFLVSYIAYITYIYICMYIVKCIYIYLYINVCAYIDICMSIYICM